jgi:Rieske Fe-S protein
MWGRLKYVVLLSVVSCSTSLPVYQLKITGNTIPFPVSNFQSSDLAIARDDQAAYDILVIRKAALIYDALFLRCTHDAAALQASPEQIVCPQCKSVYDLVGTPKVGPATKPLLRFPTETDNNQGIITINIQALKL